MPHQLANGPECEWYNHIECLLFNWIKQCTFCLPLRIITRFDFEMWQEEKNARDLWTVLLHLNRIIGYFFFWIECNVICACACAYGYCSSCSWIFTIFSDIQPEKWIHGSFDSRFNRDDISVFEVILWGFRAYARNIDIFAENKEPRGRKHSWKLNAFNAMPREIAHWERYRRYSGALQPMSLTWKTTNGSNLKNTRLWKDS